MSRVNVFENKFLVPVLALGACVLWGSAFPVLKISYQEMALGPDDYFPKILFASYRFLLASLMLFAWYYLSGGKSIKVSFQQLKFFFLLGLVQTSFQYFFFYNGLAYTPGSRASILTTLGIFFTVTVSHFVYPDDRLDWKKLWGLIAGFSGVLIANLTEGLVNFSFSFRGEGFIIISAITSTIALFMVKRVAGRIEPLLMTAYQMFLGSIALMLIALTQVSPLSLHFTAKSLGLTVYLAFISAAGFGIWYQLVKYNNLGYISIYRFMIPVSGVLLSTLILPEEKISTNLLIALLLVSTGIIMINYRGKKKRAQT